VWRYLNLTTHVVYLAQVLRRTIQEDMRNESRYLRSHSMARRMVKEIIEMPDLQIDRVIRSVLANHGKLSNALAQEVPLISDNPKIWRDIVDVITRSFQS
jgi:hypothetical protein